MFTFLDKCSHRVLEAVLVLTLQSIEFGLQILFLLLQLVNFVLTELDLLIAHPSSIVKIDHRILQVLLVLLNSLFVIILLSLQLSLQIISSLFQLTVVFILGI